MNKEHKLLRGLLESITGLLYEAEKKTRPDSQTIPAIKALVEQYQKAMEVINDGNQT